MERMDLVPAGGIFKHNGLTYKCEPQHKDNYHSCEGCAFHREMVDCNELPECMDWYRTDGIDVIFVKVEKKNRINLNESK